MSGQKNSDTFETLFSFEILVELIRIDEGVKEVSDELALGVRLLDFPTLLIYQPEQRSGGVHQQEQLREVNRSGYTFNRGKSCLFKMNLGSLHTRLSNTPLYAMVLDVKDDVPRLVGTCQVSLAGLVDRIRSDVGVHGVSTPSSQGERGLVGIFNLTGEKVGSISLGYKLRSLGPSLLPHISESRVCKVSGGHGGQDMQGSTNTTKEPSPKLEKSEIYDNIQVNGPSNEKILINKVKQGDAVCVATQTEHRPRGKMHQPFQENDYNSEDDLAVFCPPHLFYNSSVEKTSRNEVVDYELLKQDLESVILDDVCSEDEVPELEIERPRPPVSDQSVKRSAKTTSNQETSGVNPNVLGDALRQLPLLNALLVELSQLNGQSQQQPLFVHPNLAWIYKPSTEPSPEQVNTLPKAQTKLLHQTRHVASPRFEDLHSPQRCSTPRVMPVSDRNTRKEDAFLGRKPPRMSPRKKLVYGTTKTFRLRLKQNAPGLVKRHECMETHTETQTKGKTLNTSNKKIKHTIQKTTWNHISNPDEQIHTVVSDSAPQETSRLKHKNKDANESHRSSEVGIRHCKHDDTSQHHSEKHPHSEADMKLIYIPSVVGEDVTQSRDKNNHRSESCQTQPESDRKREKVESAGSSRLSSPKSTYSDSSPGGKEGGEYVDDFTSLDPSDGCSPGPLSSPEPTLAKTHKSPVGAELYSSDSASESTRRRAAFPVPVKALGSPQRSLRGTHIIRPRTQASALSLSSDNDAGDRSASIHTVRSRSQTTKSSVAESLRSSRSQRRDSTRDSAAVRGLSAESISSFEPQDIEELEDELCSLDFRNEYQHISALVANKLPGYTM
ncbi:microtubule-associated protein 10 [Diretmus argenteus]